MSLGELVVELGVIGNIKPLQDAINKTKKLTKEEEQLANAKKKVAGQIDKGIRGFRNIAATITATVYAVNKLSDALLNNNQQWITLLRQSDITLQNFQKYAEVANILDRTLGVEGAAQGLASLEQQLYKLQLTGEGASGFLLAGINPMGKSPEQVIEAIRNRISGMSDKQATFLLNQMGIDPRMLGMLRLTRSELEAINNELKDYRLTEDQRNALQQYNRQLEIARAKLRYFKDRLILGLIPVVTKLTQAAVKLIEKVKSFYPEIKRIIVTLALLKGVPIVLNLIKFGIEGIGRALIALAKNPALIGWTAAFTALYLIVDDIMTWLEGGESLFGYFLGAIDNIVEDERVPEWIRSLLKIISHADLINEWLNKTGQKAKDTVQVAGEKVKSGDFWKNLAMSALVGGTAGSVIPGLGTGAGAIAGAGMYLGGSLALGRPNTTINQKNIINTNETANTIDQQLKYAQMTAPEL